MWYFAWMLGLAMAILLAVVNALWFEMQDTAKKPQPEGETK